MPVLSEQIIETLPRPSTDFNFFTIAFSLAMREVPMAREIVMIDDSASGMAATARATANKRAFIRLSPRKRLIEKTTMQIRIIDRDSFLLKESMLCCKGVFLS